VSKYVNKLIGRLGRSVESDVKQLKKRWRENYFEIYVGTGEKEKEKKDSYFRDNSIIIPWLVSFHHVLHEILKHKNCCGIPKEEWNN